MMRKDLTNGNGLISAMQGMSRISVSIAILIVALFTFSIPARATLPNKTLVYCSEASPRGFDPAQSTTPVEYTASAFTVYNRLIEFERGTTNIGPGLAVYWDTSPDGLAYTFYLRRGVKFHTTSFFKPTRDFNADDVVFTFERMHDPEHPFRKAYPVSFPYFSNLGLDKEIAKIEKLDSYTVRFTLKSANAPFLMNLGLAFASILSAEYAEQLLKTGKAANINWWPVGTGPFIFSSYSREAQIEDSLIRFDGNPNYWKRADVQISKLVFLIVPNPMWRFYKLKRNECQVMSHPRPSDLASIEANPNLRLLTQPGLSLTYLAYNVSHEPLNSVLVRRALDMAINKKAIIAAATKSREGVARIASSPIPPALWSHDETLKDAPYDLQKAKALLTQAGYPNGLSISLWASQTQRYYNPRRIAEMVRDDWKKIGVEAKIVFHEWGEYIKRAQAGEHDVLLIGWTGNSDPDDWFGPMLTCDATSGINYSKWCHPAFDALIKIARQTNDIDKRIILYQEAQQLFKRELPFTPIAYASVYQPINKNVTNFKINPLSAILFMGVGLK